LIGSLAEKEVPRSDRVWPARPPARMAPRGLIGQVSDWIWTGGPHRQYLPEKFPQIPLKKFGK